MSKLRQKVVDMDNIIEGLEVQLKDVAAEASEEISTYCDGKYTDDMRQCCISLLSMNAGINNVGPIIPGDPEAC